MSEERGSASSSENALADEIHELSGHVRKIKVPGRLQRLVRSVPMVGDVAWDWVRPVVGTAALVGALATGLSGADDIINGPDGLRSPMSTWHLRVSSICRQSADGQPTVKFSMEDPMPGSLIHDGHTEVTGLESQGTASWHDPCRSLVKFAIPMPFVGGQIGKPDPIKRETLRFEPHRVQLGQSQDAPKTSELRPFRDHVDLNPSDQELRDNWMCNGFDPLTTLPVLGNNIPLVGGRPCVRDVHENGDEATFNIDVAGESGLTFKAGRDITPVGVNDSYDAIGTYKDSSGNTREYKAGTFTLNIISVANRGGWGIGERIGHAVVDQYVNPRVHDVNNGVKNLTGWTPSWVPKVPSIPDVNVDQGVRDWVDMPVRKAGHWTTEATREGVKQPVHELICQDAALCDTYGQGFGK